MKKKYVKPAMEIENFVLGERISSCTSSDPVFQSGCTVEMDANVLDGFREWKPNIFSSSCGEPVSGAIDVNGDGSVDVCYHTSSGTSTGYDNIFNS